MAKVARSAAALPAALALACAAAGAATLTLAAYAIHPLALPLAAAGAAFLVCAVVRPAAAVAAAVASLPLEYVRLPIGGGGLSPTEAMLAVVGLGWAVRATLAPRTAPLPRLADAPLIVALLALAAGLPVAVEPAPVVRTLVLWTLFVAAYLTVRGCSQAEVRLMIAGLAVGVGVLGAIGASDFLRAGDVETLAGGAITRQRAIGTFTDANYFASVLLLGVFPALGLALSDPRRYAWLAFPIGGAIAGIVFSLSRGGMIGLAAGVLVLLVWPRAQRTLVVAAAALLLVLAAGAMPVRTSSFSPVVERLATLDSGSATVRDRRPEIWQHARDVALDNPLVGVGVNQFVHEASVSGLYERGRPLENAHNLPLSLAAEMGFVGLAAFLVFFAQLLRRGISALSRPAGFGLKLGLLAGVVGFLAQGLTIASFRPPVAFGTFLVVAGLLTALHDGDRRR